MTWYEGDETKSKYPPSLKLEDNSKTTLLITAEPEIREVQDYNDKTKLVKKAIFPVSVDGVAFAWWVTVTFLKEKNGNPKETLFAQLSRIASTHGGISGVTVNVEVFGSGKRRVYRVV